MTDSKLVKVRKQWGAKSAILIRSRPDIWTDFWGQDVVVDRIIEVVEVVRPDDPEYLPAVIEPGTVDTVAIEHLVYLSSDGRRFTCYWWSWIEVGVDYIFWRAVDDLSAENRLTWNGEPITRDQIVERWGNR